MFLFKDKIKHSKCNFLNFFVNRVPERQLCLIFCRGKKCKHCNPFIFFKKNMVINGLNSSW